MSSSSMSNLIEHGTTLSKNLGSIDQRQVLPEILWQDSFRFDQIVQSRAPLPLILHNDKLHAERRNDRRGILSVLPHQIPLQEVLAAGYKPGIPGLFPYWHAQRVEETGKDKVK